MPIPAPTPLHSARLFLPLLLIAFAAVVFGIDRMPLFDPDEGRNAEVAREMASAQSWLVPRFHGMPYLDKPFLYFGAVALSLSAFGSGEAAARLPSVLFALGTVLTTFLLASTLYDSPTARAAAIVLATSPLFFGFARIVIFDVALTCFVILAWWSAERGRRGAAWGYPAAWACTALAVMTKGPIGLLLPVLGHVAMALGQPPPRRLARYFHPLHLVVFAAIVAPWLAAVEARVPGFLHYALVVETVERVSRPTFQRTGPLWYYLPVLALGLLPWSLVAAGRAPDVLRGLRERLRPSAGRGLAFAAVAIIGFFSLSSSKLGGYVLPALPLIAILLARAASRAAERRNAWTWVPGLTLLALGAAGIAAGLGPWQLAERLRQSATLEPTLDTLLVRAGVVTAVAGAILVALAGRPRGAAHAPAALALYLPVLVFAAAGPLAAYAEMNSSRPLAVALRDAGGDGARVAAVRCFPPGIDWYAGRLVPVVTADGGELTSTYVARNFDRLGAQRAAGTWSPVEFAARLAAGEVDFVVTRRRDAPNGGAVLLAENQKFRLWRLARAARAGS